jgi:hypothetical protein
MPGATPSRWIAPPLSASNWETTPLCSSHHLEGALSGVWLVQVQKKENKSCRTETRNYMNDNYVHYRREGEVHSAGHNTS